MRFNKQELAALASQTTTNFDREGVLIMKEKQDGFFRRTEGCSMRWFRLRGNLLFYLKGPEPWCDPIGVIILGQHKVYIQGEDENGYWPFQIVWENGVYYRLATFHDSERSLWIKAIETASYDILNSQVGLLKEKLNKICQILDISTYRMQTGIVLDMNEVPLCELALSCDNLLCDAHGRPPSPLIRVYIRHSKGLCIKYGSTEIYDKCSNPSFSKTILFRASDGLTRDAIVRIVVYDVRERFSETAVPMGYTLVQLSTIQEAQRLRVALMSRENKTVGFVTLHGWSLEPSYMSTSPVHTNDTKVLLDTLRSKVLCHRRSQSLPPRLGLKLKFPSYSTLIKQNFVNSHQVRYRFHSGLGGDITVHEIMAEPKLCYQLPIKLLDIFIQRERELLEELLSIGDICGHWQSRQLELASIHVTLLKYYCHSKRCLHQAEHAYFKASSKKDDSSLAFAPTNLHLQRLWVHNDTLNKTGFHDVVTAGAFAAHTNNAERTGGLIRLVQQVKDVSSPQAAVNFAASNKIHAEYDNVLALECLRDEVIVDMERIVVLLQAKQRVEVANTTEVIKRKGKSMLALWDPNAVEESLATVGWPDHTCCDETNAKAMSSILRLTEQLNMFDINSECVTFEASSSSSSKDTSPTVDAPSTASSAQNIYQKLTDANKNTVERSHLQFFNDYFNIDERSRFNCSFRSVRTPAKPKTSDISCAPFSFDSNKTRRGSLKYDFKSSSSGEQASCRPQATNRCAVDSASVFAKKKVTESKSDSPSLPSIGHVDSTMRRDNLIFLKSFGQEVMVCMDQVVDTSVNVAQSDTEISEEQLDSLRNLTEAFKVSSQKLVRWSRVSHAAMRLRCESPAWARDHAALQTRRDICFSQALATVTAGLLCFMCSTDCDTIVKILSKDLGPLCEFEGLLSLYSKEKAMWGDMVVAVEDLQTVLFKLTKVGHSNMAIPQVSGSRGALTVNIPVSDTLYGKLADKKQTSFTITAVFFNIGINEKATLAEALGETTPQHHSNNDNLDRLTKYYHKYNKVFPADHTAAIRASSRTKPLEDVMENLRIAVHKKTPKNVEVLHLAELAIRHMNGIRFTSCKSAKDRTGMAVTLEQCSILASEYHLAEHEMKKALNILRSEGCRRENTYKNIGSRKYAFTKKQVLALPEEYRPPPGTYGATQT